MNKKLKNPVTGHWVVFLQTAAQTGGELLQLEYGVECPEEKPAIPLHTHLQSEERFEVVAGQLGAVLDGQRRVLGMGEQVLIPPGTRAIHEKNSEFRSYCPQPMGAPYEKASSDAGSVRLRPCASEDAHS